MKRGIDRSIDNLSDRLDRLEVAKEIVSSSSSVPSKFEFQFGLTEDEYEKLTPMEKYILKFNWTVSNIIPYYKVEVMQVYHLTSEDYDVRTLNGDESIYLGQSRKFEPTSYKERIATVLGLDYRGLQDKIARGEIKDRIAIGGAVDWRDEDPNAVF